MSLIKGVCIKSDWLSKTGLLDEMVKTMHVVSELSKSRFSITVYSQPKSILTHIYHLQDQLINTQI